MKKYPVEQWHEKALSGPNMILINYHLPQTFFEGWVFSHLLPEQYSAHQKSNAYFFKRDKNSIDEAFRIDIVETDSLQAAELALLDMLTNVMAPMEFPEAAGDAPGVVSYKGFSDADSLVMFLRGNLVVRLRSIGQKEISILSEAKLIDNEISLEPKEADTKLPTIQGIDFSAPTNDLLRQLAESSESKKMHYKIVAPDHRTVLARHSIVAQDNAIPANVLLYIVDENGGAYKVELK